ncbi:MAG: glutamate-5-semialdehyde dehydrogenase [Clostridia bacterium]|nr:glutamate-5-semialdehyde dehydrogenase [Clostridia bacterium]
MTTQEILQHANSVKPEALFLTEDKKNNALNAMADCILSQSGEILAANAKDVEAAQGKISQVMIDRLMLNQSRIEGMAEGIRQVAALPDPVGIVYDKITRPSGVNVEKVSVPLGVVAIIYESRPNVTSDAAALCLKSGNVCVLRTGKEAHASAVAIVNAMRSGLEKAGLSPYFINLIEDTSRNSAQEIMTATGLVDLLIPRGGAGLINACVQNAKVPCIQTGTGICHVYVDKYADFSKALNIIENAKTSRPSVCNAMEVCLVDSAVASQFLPELWQRLVKNRKKNPVTLKLDEESYKILAGKENCVPAGETDFDTEFLDYVMAVKVVDGVEQATEHISAHSTHHSDCIVTENTANANYFVSAVDSAAVYVNVSTRFTDGGEFGLGCEMGISTQKLHARGPMGLKELTSYKYVVRGNGQIR